MGQHAVYFLCPSGKIKCTHSVSAVTHSEGSHARLAGLGGLAGGSWSWGSLVLGISALAGGGLGSLRHGEGLQESLGERWRKTRG